MSIEQHEQNWEDLGSVDPYWAILSRPSSQYGKWDVDEFFATGQQEIAKVMKVAETLAHPVEHKVALDFGCGVGRLSRAMASIFEQVYGVDISSNMIDTAKELHKNHAELTFLVNKKEKLTQFPDEQFDFIYTNRVLQHIPHRDGIRAYISEFVRTLKPGGLVVFQVLSYVGLRQRLQPRRRLYLALRSLGFNAKFLYEKLQLNPIKMNFIPREDVLEFLGQLGAEVLRVEDDPTLDKRNKSSVYYVTKR